MQELDGPAETASLWRSIQPNSMTFLHRGQTQGQLIAILHKAIFQPEPHYNRTWLLASEAQCFLTFIVCAIMLIKKKSLGKLWILTKRDSPYGSFLGGQCRHKVVRYVRERAISIFGV